MNDAAKMLRSVLGTASHGTFLPLEVRNLQL
jgi:hypothetical protein